MNSRLLATVGLCLLVSSAVWAGELKSGPQVGAGVSAFHPKNILNAEVPKNNGTEACLV